MNDHLQNRLPEYPARAVLAASEQGQLARALNDCEYARQAVLNANSALELVPNVSIFDGTSEKLITGKDIVVSGNKIEGCLSGSYNPFAVQVMGFDLAVSARNY